MADEGLRAFAVPSPLTRPGPLSLSEPEDAVERDAERLADRVAPRPSGARGSRGPSVVDSSAVWDAIASPSRPLEGHERHAAPGLDPSGVRLHSGDRAAESARALGASAYAVGDHIVLGNRYDSRSAAGRRGLVHELAHVAQQRSNPGPPLVRRDLAVAPPHPTAAPILSDAAAADAIAFNSRTISDPAEIEMLRDILGLAPTPAVVDADFVRAVATYQAGYGLTVDGKVGPLTRRRLSGEILTESAGLPAGGLGSLATGLQLRTTLTRLIGAGNTNYADYRNQIRAATVLQRDVCLADTAFLTQLCGRLAWDDFARCVELLGRQAPAFGTLTADPTVAAALAAAWRPGCSCARP